ncbi:phospholipase-like protein, partial [Tanacetum coccineum]
FALITGLPFGTVNFSLYTFGELKFHNRVFPHKLGLSVTKLDVIGVIEDEETFRKLRDQDFIRLCLILALEVIFIGDRNYFPWGEHIWTHLYDEIKNVIEKHSDEHYFGMKKDRMYVPTYTLYGFVFAFQVLARERNEEYGDFVIEDESRLCLEDEERMRLEEEKNIIAEQRFRVEEAGKTNPTVSWVKINKHCQNVNDPSLLDLLKKVKPWVEDLSCLFHSLDTVWLTPNIERFISQQGQVKCKFPWSDDYTVGRNFWLTLACLDPSRKGWLSEEVFFPINEKAQHWCLAHLDILSGLFTFYDSGDTYDYEWRDCNYGVLGRYGVSMPALTKDHKGKKINTPYPEEQYAVLEILEEEKARRRSKVYNWETATYGKIWDNEDVYDLGSVETKFPAIIFNDTLTSEATLTCEPTVSSLNDNEIDFRISFDESGDEDYTNEFPAIVYNDALTSKFDFSTEPTLSPQHIDEFDLKDETSLSECDEEGQNVLYFNNLFPFNVIYPDDLKSDTDNYNDEIDIEQPSGDMFVIPLPNAINVNDGAYAHGSNKLLETRPHEGKSTNVGGEFTNLEILTCWSLETSRQLFNTNSNADALRTDLLDSLLKMALTKEKERKLNEHIDDTSIKLGHAEKFLKAALNVPFDTYPDRFKHLRRALEEKCKAACCKKKYDNTKLAHKCRGKHHSRPGFGHWFYS